MSLSELVRTAIAIAVLVGITYSVLRRYEVPHRAAPARAVLRGALQLVVVSAVLTAALRSPWWIALVLMVMLCVASVTAARRLGASRSTLLMTSTAVASGVAVTLLVVFTTGTLELSARYALAIGGIVIGNAMSVCTLAGRHWVTTVRAGWEEVEGWLALGATARESTRDFSRSAAFAALVPSTDQTRTTGLVTLPGAFVGAIFGGLSPWEAGRFQIVVLAGIMCTGSIATVITTRWLSQSPTRPAPLP